VSFSLQQHPLLDLTANAHQLTHSPTAAKQKCLKRGVKEVVKAVRKTTPSDPATAQVAAPAIVILAADISPMDVISHIPVLCEDHNIPYVFLPSRAELGAAGSTKRPTSVVMVTPNAGKKGEDKDDEWDEAYKELNKLVVKQGQHVKV
jgi:H/ACA ribonucleoprotein complex subunit 2